MLEAIDFHGNLVGIDSVTVGGESGMHARPCNYDWILDVRKQCEEVGVGFHFKQTGGKFVKGNKTYNLSHRVQMEPGKLRSNNLIYSRLIFLSKSFFGTRYFTRMVAGFG